MLMSENEQIARHAPLVRRVALQLVARLPASVELDDLIQAGMIGLLDAVRRYQESPGAQFETYATTRIRGAMLDELRSQDWLPRSVRSKNRQLEDAVHKLQQTLLRAPTEREIASAMGLSLPDYQQLLDEARGAQILHFEDLVHTVDDAAVSAAGAGQLPGDPVTRAGGDPLAVLMSDRLRAVLIQAISDLPEREKLLLALQFEQDLNQKEIAAVMGVTEGRVSQLRSQAIARIRAALAAQNWDALPDDLSSSGLL